MHTLYLAAMSTANGPGIIDACLFHDWTSIAELTPYMSAGWEALLMRQGDTTGPADPRSQWLLRNPFGDLLPGAEVVAGFTVADAARVIDDANVANVVLGYHEGLLATAFPIPEIARTVVSAANDWTLDRWLSADSRLRALMLISTGVPTDAAGEIRRCGHDARFVGVALGANALGRPFGHRIYEPIYSAAAEFNLPLVLQTGTEAMSDSSTGALAGGRAATYAEFHAQGAGAYLAHVTSMIINGVFERYPNLRLLLVGGGVAWIPSYLWRLDYLTRLAPGDARWLRRPPSEYFVEHVRVSTYSLEDPPDSRLLRLLETIPQAESMLLYASGYPRWDAATASDISHRLPGQWHDRVFGQNAREFFRWGNTPNVDNDRTENSSRSEVEA
jgi:predicted TIM-barrel fold metal-dependent hydrolase